MNARAVAPPLKLETMYFMAVDRQPGAKYLKIWSFRQGACALTVVANRGGIFGRFYLFSSVLQNSVYIAQ